MESPYKDSWPDVCVFLFFYSPIKILLNKRLLNLSVLIIW